mmetsp:Transcript_10872/g.16558  ORF Transcript_10872/g.16558 Transcript_10872/m.16558 type:complete len:241 (+) Transcript_10872:83-805(+)
MSGNNDKKKVEDLYSRLQAVKGNSSGTTPVYDELQERLNSLKSSSVTPCMDDLNKRFQTLTTDASGPDEKSPNILPHHTMRDEEDDFMCFIDDNLGPSNDSIHCENLDQLEQMLSCSGRSCEDAYLTGSGPQGKDDLDNLIAEASDEVRLLHKAHPVSKLNKVSASDAVVDDYKDEYELLKRVFMSAQDEARLEGKYGNPPTKNNSLNENNDRRRYSSSSLDSDTYSSSLSDSSCDDDSL